MSLIEAIGFYITGGSLVQVLCWWVVLFGIGIAFLPVCARLFSRFFDKGYAFSKVLGMVTAVYITWLAASLRIAPFTRVACIYAVVFIALAGVAAIFGSAYLKTFRRNLKVMLFEETIFLFALLLWSFIRSLNPEIHGLEKFMDYGFMTSILNSSHMPPSDPWFSGSTINYYYFGHFTYAWLTRLTGIDPPTAFNLSVATLFAFSFSLVHSLVSNMVYLRKDCSKAAQYAAGLISAVLFTLGGNLYTAVYGFALPVLKALGVFHGVLSSTYPNATRFVGFFPPTSDKLITEMPSYSFVVADLHAHVMSIPLVLTILGLCLGCMQTSVDRRDGTGQKNGMRVYIIPFMWMSFVLSAAVMTNAWTLPTGALTICVVFGIAWYQKSGKYAQGALAFVLAGLAVACMTAIFTLPFQMHFKSFSQGIRLSDAHIPFWQMLILWGYQLLIAAWFFVALLQRNYRAFGDKITLDAKTVSCHEQVGNTCWGLINKRKSALRMTASDYIAIAFVLCALVFIAIPEFVYMKDIYSYDYRRANTVFKLSYEAFTLLTVMVGYFAVVIVRRLVYSSRRMIAVVVLIMVLYLPLTFTWLALMQRCKLPAKPRYWGMNGLAYMASVNPGDYNSAKWLQKNAPEDAIILEAEGDSYTDYARISMMSGRQTVLGWFVHEWLWRGEKNAVEARRRDIKSIYEATNTSKAASLLRKYNVCYLAIGSLEKERYSSINLSVIMKLGKVVFRSGDTVIVKIDSCPHSSISRG